MQAPNSDTVQFDADLTPVYHATYWDTSMAAPRRGVGYAAFTIGALSGFDLSAPADHAALEAVLTDPAQMTPILGFDEAGAYGTGVVANVYDYWGAGAPLGVTRERQALLKFFGAIQVSADVTLVLGGQGRVRVFVDQVEQVLSRGRVQEPQVEPALTETSPRADVEREAGYQILDLSLTEGQTLEIYYAHSGETWGGVFAKAFPQSVPASTWAEIRDALRRAAVVGPAFLSVAGVSDAGTDLPDAVSAELEVQTEHVASLTLRLPLGGTGGTSGYRIGMNGDVPFLIENGSASPRMISVGRRLHFAAGYLGAGGAEETYARFTGLIDDLYEADADHVVLTCSALESKLQGEYNQNYPDRLSYHANAFVLREWYGDPVWEVPAYDAWPLELALADLAYRGGLDASVLGLSASDADAEAGHAQFRRATDGTLVVGRRLFEARALGDATEWIRLPRSKNYGNVGALKKDYLPHDDAYLFQPELSDDLYTRALALASRYGYDLWTTAEGQLRLGARDNATAFDYDDSIRDAAHEAIAPAAVTGRYFRIEDADGAWTKTITGDFARLDLLTGIGVETASGLNGGRISVQVDVWTGSAWAARPDLATTISTYLAPVGGRPAPEAFYYDDVLRTDGTNATVFSVLASSFDRYRVTLTPAGLDPADTSAGATNALYRINGVALYETDAHTSPFPVLSTLDNVLTLAPKSERKEMRNEVIVVGAREAVITDSAKFAADNPNNPAQEHFVSVAVDVGALYDPTAANYVGAKRLALVIDDSVTDQGFATWLARSTLLRYRTPRAATDDLQHSAIPTLELRDPLFVRAERTGSLNHLLYVERYKESWSPEEATVHLSLTSFAEGASYVPREDLDVDTLFRSDPDDPTSGLPVLHVALSYQNLYGISVGNSVLSAANPSAHLASALSPVSAVSPSQTLPAYTIPESLFLRGTDPDRALVNHPYRHFWDLSFQGTQPVLTYDFQEGDGTPGVYDAAYYGFPAKYTVHGKGLSAGRSAAENPFYDPYTSEFANNFVTLSFDALLSGFYRVSLWAADRESDPIPLAWLTEPTHDPLEPEAHWTFMDPGTVTLLFDGVDNIGAWNRRQSEVFAKRMDGAFEEAPLAVGAGFYAWNDETSGLFVQVGDAVAENYDAEGPIFTEGKYAKFYVRIDVSSDRLLRASQDKTPRTVRSDALVTGDYTDSTRTARGTEWNDVPATFLYTHLAEPTHVGITAWDWDESQGAWSPTTSLSAWVATPDADATLGNTKPVRFTFQPRARRGVLYGGDETQTSVQLTRYAHLKTTVFDQFLTRFGTHWDDLGKNNATSAEEKRITSRMFHNEQFTKAWADTAWRTGSDLSSLEWIFTPDQFKMDFGGGTEEVLQYGSYEQLEALPGFDPKQSGGTSTAHSAYLTMAFLSYLFYFSAATLDRSGRRQWCLRERFIDRSKIVSPAWLARAESDETNAYAVHYERRGTEQYLARSLFARQWVEPYWTDATDARSPLAVWSITDAHQQAFVQPYVKDFNPLRQALTGATAATDAWLTAYQTAGSDANHDILRSLSVLVPSTYDRPTYPSVSVAVRPSAFGTWGFDRGGLVGWFSPSPVRDFHPYWRLPLMPDWGWNDYEDYQQLNVLLAAASNGQFQARDLAAQERWFGVAWSEQILDYVTKWTGARLEITARDWAGWTPRQANELADLLDYEKVDTLDRFDQYRGVWSRGPLPDRDHAGTGYDQRTGDRAVARQPIHGTGAYLLNTGNYTDYTAAQSTKDQGDVLHFASHCGDLYDLRFRHETVWYSDRYFPVSSGNGGAMYMLFRDEQTGVSQEIDVSAVSILFDAGAWTGWKDDAKRTAAQADTTLGIDCTSWETDPHLRWRDHTVWHLGSTIQYVGGGSFSSEGSASRPYLSGGFGDAAWGSGTALRAEPWMNQTYWYRRANLLDEGYVTNEFGRLVPSGKTIPTVQVWPWNHHLRLAVGPRVPESRELKINLVTPRTYAGL